MNDPYFVKGGEFYPATSATPRDALLADLAKSQPGLLDKMTPGEIEQLLTASLSVPLWRNEVYTVSVFREGADPDGLTHLSIKRNDRQVIHDWRDLQGIKNVLCGADREAVEIYPAEDRLVDTANQYHLWVLPKGERVPFGFGTRNVVDIIAGTRLQQRKFERRMK